MPKSTASQVLDNTPESDSQQAPKDPNAGASGRRSMKWSFITAPPVILLLMVVGHVVGLMLSPWPLFRAFASVIRGDTAGAGSIVSNLFSEMEGRDWLFTAFLLATAGFVWFERKAVKKFFRSMYTGVSLVVLTTIAITAGVLVPQIEGFEDPEQRVDMEREAQRFAGYKERGYLTRSESNTELIDGTFQEDVNQYGAFRWAEGYFFYHLFHMYGIGMPKAELPPGITERLDAFGQRYGDEERNNREKRMRAAFSGQAKTQAIGEWIKGHEDFLWGFFKVSTALELNRAYKSNWFAALLFMLSISVALNMLRGKPSTWFTWRKAGHNLAHIGLVTILVGGMVSNLGTDRGILRLDLRDARPKDTYFRHYNSAKLSRMPFALGLEHFARKEWKALEVYFDGDDFQSKVPRYTLWKGRPVELDYVAVQESDQYTSDAEKRPRLRLEVDDLHERMDVGRPLIEESSNPNTQVFPVIAYRWGSMASQGQEDSIEEGLLSSEFPEWSSLDDPFRRWRLRTAFGDRLDPKSMFPERNPSGPMLGRIFAQLSQQDVEAQPYPLNQSESLALQGGYEVKVLQATTNFRIDRDTREPIPESTPLAQQPLGIRAVEVEISSPSGQTEQRWLIEGIDPVAMGVQSSYELSDLVLHFVWDTWTSPGPDRYVLHWGESTPPTLVSESGDSRTVDMGSPVPLPPPTQLVLEESFLRPEFERNLTVLETLAETDGWDGDFYTKEPRGLNLTVIHDPDTAMEQRESIQMASTEAGGANLWQSGDGRFFLYFLENTDVLPFEWRSVLKIYDKGPDGSLTAQTDSSKQQREIRVNDYLYHRGYRFFQTDARADIPTYSGIGVVYDPGIPIVLWGMYIVIAGTAVAFLLRPIMGKRRESSAAAA